MASCQETPFEIEIEEESVRFTGWTLTGQVFEEAVGFMGNSKLRVFNGNGRSSQRSAST